ncbi:hypothetical protein SISSUDRAFT_1065571 [Sistotremastrum suecicum HHB10207 ss-3]|uniref:Uncharacterized protein n=1 Tax=Sistotremastrum suecicum HHB10207 ss-3 TaxID=1314776 RepID=A0A165ZBJ1_9AGAM|nr:hypothetical protein SISSUDRAFT_1065571 [Sistotremastrum suecicum HHB10207 ss-3]
MFSKLVIAFGTAIASCVAVNAQIQSGTLTEYTTTPSTFTCGEASGAGPVIAVAPAILEEFGCGHPVTIFFGSGDEAASASATVGQLDTGLSEDLIRGPIGIFVALGASGPSPIAVTWEP